MATPREVLEQADGMELVDEDGNKSTIELLPPLAATEMAKLEERIGPLPEDVRELLEFSRGFSGVMESVDLYGQHDYFSAREAFPHGHPIASDGFGNFWVVDVRPGAATWDGIFFACHDPAVFVFQTDSLAEFLAEVIRFGNPPWESAINDVHEDHAMRIWHEKSRGLTVADSLASDDDTLAEFAATLDDTFEIFDLREAGCGDGFAWGRYGPCTVLRRHGMERLFAIQIPPRKPSLLGRLFGRSAKAGGPGPRQAQDLR
ncbi:SMI1/KNR4 family protein [bacterium]|nr:SMI1/KNR4 family protein [bacterium]